MASIISPVGNCHIQAIHKIDPDIVGSINTVSWVFMVFLGMRAW
jgi:hypothetical protein